MCVCLELLYTAGHTTLADQGKIALSNVLVGIAWLILVIGLPSQYCLLAPQHIPEVISVALPAPCPASITILFLWLWSQTN